jgi:hypothetical protein
VGAVGDAVDDGCCEPGVGEGPAPFNWKWHTFVWAEWGCCLVDFPSACHGDVQGVSGVY